MDATGNNQDATRRGVTSLQRSVFFGIVATVANVSGCGSDTRDTPISRSQPLQLKQEPPPAFNAAVFDDGSGAVDLPADVVAATLTTIDPLMIPGSRRRNLLSNVGSAAPPTRSSSTDDLLTMAAVMAPSTPIRVFVTVDDLPFVWMRFRAAANDQEQKAVVQDRIAQVDAAVANIRARLVTLGATDLIETWLVPALEATVRAEDVKDIASWPDVRDVMKAESPTRPLTEYTDAFSGLESRAGMRTTAFISAGIKGQSGGHAGGSIRVGLMERYWDAEHSQFDHASWQHSGFVDCTSGCINRWGLGDISYCNSGTCTQQLNPINSDIGGPTHANLCLQIMAGSIETGSDTSIPDTNGRIRRSGIAPLARPWHYEIDDACSSRIAAMQRAITDKLDVFDFSSAGTCTCSVTCNDCAMNASLYNLQSSGVLWVNSLGDTEDDPSHSCNAQYPAMRREGLTVASVDTTPQTVNYDTAGLRLKSSRGGMDLPVYGEGTQSRAVAIADLAAPGCWTYQYFNPPSNGYAANLASTNYGCGTSFAAPAVAGAAALLRQQLVVKGWIMAGGVPSPDDVGTLMVNMLLMGDGYSYDLGGFRTSGFDQRSGAGRVHMHYPSGANLTAPWGWGTHSISLANGEAATFWVGSSGAESPSVTQWKLALTWVETDYSQASDIIVRVYDSCHGNAIVASDDSFDMRKRITLTQSQISNKCLYYRIDAFSIRPGTYVRLYVADYFHSGNPADH